MGSSVKSSLRSIRSFYGAPVGFLFAETGYFPGKDFLTAGVDLPSTFFFSSLSFFLCSFKTFFSFSWADSCGDVWIIGASSPFNSSIIDSIYFNSLLILSCLLLDA